MAIATAGLSLVGGASKFFEGRAMQNRAQDAIRNFRFNELQNPYRTTSVSTLGADLRREQASAANAASIDALRASGTRGVLGGLQQVQSQSNLLNQQIAADLDRQQKQIDFAAAQQDVRNQELINQRKANELAGYGQALNVGRGMKYGGLGELVNVAGFAGQQGFGQRADAAIEGLFSGGQAPPRQTAPPATTLGSSLAPVGLQGFGNFDTFNNPPTNTTLLGNQGF